MSEEADTRREVVNWSGAAPLLQTSHNIAVTARSRRRWRWCEGGELWFCRLAAPPAVTHPSSLLVHWLNNFLIVPGVPPLYSNPSLPLFSHLCRHSSTIHPRPSNDFLGPSLPLSHSDSIYPSLSPPISLFRPPITASCRLEIP